jgi:hypothetical protein
MAGRVTLQDIADELGLSRNTVSKAINNTGVLADSTRERVLRKAKEMGYKQFTYLQFKEDFTTELGILTHSNSTASGERKKEIAVLSSGFIGGSHFAQRMIDRFQHDFSAVGYSISMYRVMPEEIQSLRLPSSFDPENISGIMCIELFQADYCRMLCSLNLPVLLVDGPVSVFEGSFGADQLLMDSGVETTGWDRSTIKTDYDNNDAEAAGERNWRTGVTRTWSLRTGVLTDDQAARMHHVTGSVQAYLYDMAEGVVLPVIMTDAAIEERSYRQGRRKIEYTVGCRLAQTEIRR